MGKAALAVEALEVPWLGVVDGPHAVNDAMLIAVVSAVRVLASVDIPLPNLRIGTQLLQLADAAVKGRPLTVIREKRNRQASGT